MGEWTWAPILMFAPLTRHRKWSRLLYLPNLGTLDNLFDKMIEKSNSKVDWKKLFLHKMSFDWNFVSICKSTLSNCIRRFLCCHKCRSKFCRTNVLRTNLVSLVWRDKLLLKTLFSVPPQTEFGVKFGRFWFASESFGKKPLNCVENHCKSS